KCNKNTCSCITLPTHWNPDDCGSRIVIIDEKKLIVKHTGPVLNFYITIRFIGIGLSKPGTPLDRMPGWGTGTIGYHGDNGRLYYERERGVNFGPLYTTGETVGCGINFFDNEIFFTKNGILLGKMVLFKLEKKIYPTCGMASPNECVFVNFGTDPFIFPIDHYAKKTFSKAEKCK
ncbi:24568_t:CDS:2, partial [Gigaspora margarita]